MIDKSIVALSIDKVQTFLTETIHSQVQEKQTEAATLKNIMNASGEISGDFHRAIEDEFSEVQIEKLLACSGVYVFSCNMKAADIGDKLNNLFLHYYQSSQGQKIIRCLSFSRGNYNEIEAIQEAKKQLKQSESLNQWIERNKDVVFAFCTVEAKKLGAKQENTSYTGFVKDINALFCEEESDNPNHFRIAVIKADLDGMGDMFKGIDNYENYCTVSEILNEEVSLDGLHRSADSCKPGRNGWLFPFYIAGDDIFFAVSVNNLTKGIQVCKRLLHNINTRLSEAQKLSMSIGVEITFNREPIRYYMEMVERQLKEAKAAAPGALAQFLQTKISICGLAYLDIDYNAVRMYKEKLKCTERESPQCKCKHCQEKRKINNCLQSRPIWGFFLKDVRRLHEIRADNDQRGTLLGTPGFFYTLLERLNDETVLKNDVRYINSVLYHLQPEFISSSNKKLRNYELILKAGILSQLMKRQGKKGMTIVLNEDTKKRLETYLRIMLLFSDSRFSLMKNSELQAKKQPDSTELDNARKYMLSKTTDYLYQALRGKGLSEIFIKKAHYEKNNDKGKTKIPCFQRLKIEKSMFIKLRDTKRVSVKKAAEILELQNPLNESEINALNQSRENEEKAPGYLYFNKEKFLQLANQKDAWTPDFIDSLMLLYEYNDFAISLPKKSL